MSTWYFEYNPYVRIWMAHDHKNITQSSVLYQFLEEMALKLIEQEKAEKVRKMQEAAISPDSSHNGDERYCWEWKSSDISKSALRPFGKENQ